VAEPVQIVEILKNKVWVESDIIGSRHVMIQQGDSEPFQYASFYYDYRFTSNAHIAQQADKLAISLGASEPVECRVRTIDIL
jgi:hypothetical protein